MAYKKIEESIWKPEKEDDFVEGVLIKVDDSSAYDSKVYHLENGSVRFAVFGSCLLDDAMKFVKPGDKIKIVFKGTKKSEDKKKQPYKLFEVFKDEPEGSN